MKYLLLTVLLLKSVVMAADSRNTEVTIYHDTRDPATKKTILQEGLYCYDGLVKRKIKEDRPMPFSDHNKNIYFYYPTLDNKIDATTTVGYKVNPNKTYVYNRDLRLTRDREWYLASKILLRDYIERLNKKRDMEKNCKPCHKIVEYPHSAEPFELDMTSDLGQGYLEDFSTFNYCNEIIIEAECIPPTQLVDLQTMNA